MSFVVACFVSYIYLFPMYFAIRVIDGYIEPRFSFTGRRWVSAFLLCSVMILRYCLINNFGTVLLRFFAHLSMIFLLYKWKPVKIISVFFLALFLLICAEMVTWGLFAPLDAFMEQAIVVGSFEFILFNCACVTMMSGVYILFLKIRHVIGDRHSRKHWAFISYFILVIILTMFIAYLRTEAVHSVLTDGSSDAGFAAWMFHSRFVHLLIIAVLISALPVLLTILCLFLDQARKGKEKELINHQLQIEMDKANQWKNEMLLLKHIRHDLKNHLAIIDALEQTGGGQKRQRQYIQEVLLTLDTDQFIT